MLLYNPTLTLRKHRFDDNLCEMFISKFPFLQNLFSMETENDHLEKEIPFWKPVILIKIFAGLAKFH